MKVPFGHLMIDLNPSCPDCLRFSSNVCCESISTEKQNKNKPSTVFYVSKEFPLQWSTVESGRQTVPLKKMSILLQKLYNDAVEKLSIENE